MSIQYVLRTENSKFNYTPTYFQGMKNVMVFVSVDFDKVKVEDGWSYMKDDDYMNKTIRFIKAQIDNSLELNWKVEDIILATNFLWSVSLTPLLKHFFSISLLIFNSYYN